MPKEKPTKKVNSIAREEMLEEKGLNPETVTKDQIADALKVVLDFQPTDKGMTLFANDQKGKRHVKVAYMNSSAELIEKLMEKLTPLKVEFTKGVSTIQRQITGFGPKYNHIHMGLNTLEFDISDDQRKETRKLIAEFINEEAAKDPVKWTIVSEIQNGASKSMRV